MDRLGRVLDRYYASKEIPCRSMSMLWITNLMGTSDMNDMDDAPDHQTDLPEDMIERLPPSS